MPRIKVPGHAAGYHVVTRTRGRQFLLDEQMKQYFVQLLGRLKTLYYVDYTAFCVLDNHYHLLLRFQDPEGIDPSDAMGRWNRYHDGSIFVKNETVEADRQFVVRELCDLSGFMKRFNYHLTIRYNWLNRAEGTLWQKRFQSCVVERGLAMLNCAAYIDLNAFRASLARNPEDYPYASLFRLHKLNPDNLLAPDLLNEGLDPGITTIQETVQAYTAFIYRAGCRPHKEKPDGIVMNAEMLASMLLRGLKADPGYLSNRIPELAGGKVTGSREYASALYADWINPGLSGERGRRHKARWMTALGGSIWSVCSSLVRGSP